SQSGLTPAGLGWYAPGTYFATGSKPWYHEFHWHGLQLLAGNSAVLAGLACLAALAVAAVLGLAPGHPRAPGPWPDAAPGPGQRVLEIGAGTGYNAALMQHIVGAPGAVISVDIDADLAARAREHLASAGYPDVTVVAADGADGYPPGAPYDRVIATVGVSDLA